jgi:EmrB/QacA subfamily drug resistance transporter
MQQQHTDTVDYSRKWYVMAAVSAGVFLATIDGSIVNIAVPRLKDIFDTDLAIVQWVVLAYLLTVTTLLLSVGRLADIIGKKSIYTVGFVVFTIGSALCAAANTVGWLIGFRVLQAVGAAMVMSLGPAITTEAFPASERGRALGIIGMAVSAGIITGPVLGGFLLKHYSWHWIFLVNIPVGVVGTMMVLRFVPNIPPRGGQRFDIPGALTFFISLISLLLALTFGQQFTFTTGWIWLLLATWLGFLVLFLFIQWRSEQPMVDLRLFAEIDFSVGLITGFITFVLIGGVLFLMPFYLINIQGYDQFVAGQLLAVLPLSLGVAAPLSGWLSDRFGTRLITMIGLGVLVIAYSIVTQLDSETTAFGFVLVLLPVGIGMGIFQSPNNSAILGAVPTYRLGVASGLLAIARTLGQTTGIAVLNAVWASRVLVHTPDTVSGDATDAAPAAQVAGLHDTFLFATGLIVVALLISIGGWFWQRKQPSVLPQTETFEA